jgi:Zn-finger nucleic acid-binding protein
MNCVNCGAAMELYESRGYFFCAHCGSIHFPQPPDDEGLRVVGQEQDPPMCPVCAAPLSAATLDGTPVHVCQKCRGILLARGAFAHVVESRRAWASSPPAPPRPLEPRELERKVLCPRCGTRMATHPYLGPGAIVMDTCESCDNVWLDANELKRIVDAPGKDRGSRGVPEQPWAPTSIPVSATDPDVPRTRHPDLVSLLLDLLE